MTHSLHHPVQTLAAEFLTQSFQALAHRRQGQFFLRLPGFSTDSLQAVVGQHLMGQATQVRLSAFARRLCPSEPGVVLSHHTSADDDAREDRGGQFEFGEQHGLDRSFRQGGGLAGYEPGRRCRSSREQSRGFHG